MQACFITCSIYRTGLSTCSRCMPALHCKLHRRLHTACSAPCCQLTSLNGRLILPYVNSLKTSKHHDLNWLSAGHHAASIGEPPSGPASAAPFMPSGSSLYRYCVSQHSTDVRRRIRHTKRSRPAPSACTAHRVRSQGCAEHSIIT